MSNKQIEELKRMLKRYIMTQGETKEIIRDSLIIYLSGCLDGIDIKINKE